MTEGHASSPTGAGGMARSRLGRMSRAGAPGVLDVSGEASEGEGMVDDDEHMQQEDDEDDEQEEAVVLVPMEVMLQGVRHMAAGMCFSVAVLEHGDVFSWGLGGWGALGHGDRQDCDVPTRISGGLLEGVTVERVSCGQYHTTFIARDGIVYGCGRYEAGQLGHVIPQGLDATYGGLPNSSDCIISSPIRLQITSALLEELCAVHVGGGQGSPFQESSPAGHGSSNSCSDAMSDGESGDVAAGARAARSRRDSSDGVGEGEDVQAMPSPTKTISYEAPVRSPHIVPGVVLHEVVAGGCNTAILLRKQQETPSPWQVTLLAKLQAAVARALALQSGGGGPSQQLAMALRNVARGASLVLSSPAALCAALAVRSVRPTLLGLDAGNHTPTAALIGTGPFGGGASRLGGSPRHRQPRAVGVTVSPGPSAAQTPRAGSALAVPLPLPLDILLLDQLYCSLLELSGVSKEPAALGSLSTDYDQGPAMCELQRYGLQQALLRCGLTLCEDLMNHAPLLRAPDRAQVLLAALHCPLLSDPACCKQLLPKLCHAVLAAPAAARRLLVRWWASYPPDLLLERLVQPMQAFITKELAAVKKLTSSIMAVIKVLARVEAANQLAGGLLPPEAFYNTLISEKMDVQDHYSAWRTTQDLGGGLPGVRPVTNTSGAQYYACEPDSESDTPPLTSPTSAPPSRTRSAAGAASMSVSRTNSGPSQQRAASTAATTTPVPNSSASSDDRMSPMPMVAGRHGPRASDAGSDTLDWEQERASDGGMELAGGQAAMRMSDPGRRACHSVCLPPINPGSHHMQGSSGSSSRRTLTGSVTELQQQRSRTHNSDSLTLPPCVSSPATVAHAGSTSASPNRGRQHTQTTWAEAQPAITLPPLPSPPSGVPPRARAGLPPRSAPSGSNSQSSQAQSMPQQPADLDERYGHAGRGRAGSRMSEPGSPPPRAHAGAARAGAPRHMEWAEADAEAAAPTPPAAPTPRPAAEPGPFSFCTYPFLLDARAKSNLLHIEARFQMEQTVAHARMEQQLYGQHTRFMTRSDSGVQRPRGRGEAGAAGSSSSSGAAGGGGMEEAIMMQVLDKVAAAEEAEDEDEDLTNHTWGSTSPRGGSAGARVGSSAAASASAVAASSTSGAASGSGRAIARSSSSSGRTKGFRGLLAALLRHGGMRSGSSSGSQAAADAEEVAALMSDKRAESFKLPRPSECTMPGTHSDMCILRVRRTHLVEDALDEITRQVRRDLFKPLRVHFIGEDGIDAGGVKKEFFALLLAELLKPEFGLMESQPDSNTYWFPRHSMCKPHQYQLLGLVLGLAVYNRVLLDFPLPMSAYKKLLGVPVGLRELTEMCPPMGKSLKQLLELEGPPGTIEDLLCLTWAVEGEAWGVRTVMELVPGGEELSVTEENRSAYVDTLVNHYLYESVKWQFEAFARGFGVMCNGPALRLFNAQELERLVCGNPILDWGALQRNAKYEGGYTPNSPVVVWLWDMVRNELPLEEKKRFLKFFTGSDRAPIGGLGTLRCLIQRAGPDSARLPTSHTCFNTLLLPEYFTRARLAKQLRTAINNSEGFGLE